MKEELKQLLKEGVVEVIFTKVNGEERVMDCTLKSSLIPTEHKPTEAAQNESEDVQRVYSIDSSGWRSFRWDNLKAYTQKL